MNPIPCSSLPARTAGTTMRRRRLGLAWIVLLTSWSLAASAEEPLQLGNEQIGMTAEAMSKTDAANPGGSAPGPTAKPEATPPAPTEWASGADASDPWAPADAHAGVSPAATSYEACVELAIQQGNGFAAASGVCQAIFPESVAPPQAAQAEAPGQAAPQEPETRQTGGVNDAPSADDDGPLVLTLDGPVPSVGGSGAGD